MSSTHRRHLTGRAALRSLLVVAALGAATLIPTTASAQAASDVAQLRGPLGSRAGVPIEDPTVAPDPASIAPFDTVGREPPLQLWFDGDSDQGEGWSAWEVIATSIGEAPAEPLTLAAGVAEVPLTAVDLAAPPPGDWLVQATLVNGTAGPEGTWAWHVVVPDRTLPADIPVPGLVLFGGGRTAVSEQGSVCYLGSCGDIGEKPPARAVPLISLDRADEPIALTLSDGSGIATVSVTAQLLNVDESDPVVLLDQVDAGGTNVVAIPAPPSVGRWYLEVFVRFTDARGSAVGYARVAVPQP